MSSTVTRTSSGGVAVIGGEMVLGTATGDERYDFCADARDLTIQLAGPSGVEGYALRRQ